MNVKAAVVGPVVGLLVLVLLVGAGNLWASWSEVHTFKQQLQSAQAAEQKAAMKELAALCTDVGTMSRIPAPPGPAASNPSRAYEQAEHRAWEGLYTGIECGKLRR